MQTNVNWYGRLSILLVVLVVVFVAAACGGNGSNGLTTSVNPDQATSAAPDLSGRSNGAVDLAVSENEIGRLSAEQQALLSDAGWNQPYIVPKAGTPIQGPSHEML
ncbi:hypothetical protein KDL30_07175, partial [bacterium]|nr:hypothetical protein [bacterium]